MDSIRPFDAGDELGNDIAGMPDDPGSTESLISADPSAAGATFDRGKLLMGGLALAGATALLLRDPAVRGLCMNLSKEPQVRQTASALGRAVSDAWTRHDGTAIVMKALFLKH